MAVLELDFCGRALDSAIPLPALQEQRPRPGIGSTKRLEIRSPSHVPALATVGEWRHVWTDEGDVPNLQVRRMDDGRYRLRFPHQCDVLIDIDAGRLDIEQVHDLPPQTLEHLLIDQALPRLLAFKGELVVHASAVALDGRCALFLGRSGWGKSTLAGMLHQHGATTMSDDCLLLETENGRALATPSYPSLRLFDDSIRQIFQQAPPTVPVAEDGGKLRVQLDRTGAARHGHGVSAIYLLDAPSTATTMPEIRWLRPSVACMGLVEHGFRLDPTDHSETVRLLRKAGELVRMVPAYTLSYPRDFDQREDLLAMLVNHLATHPPGDSNHV